MVKNNTERSTECGGCYLIVRKHLVNKYGTTSHYCVFLCRILPRIQLKKAESCTETATSFYIIVHNYSAVVGIYIYIYVYIYIYSG
jgi:hypothetical protein